MSTPFVISRREARGGLRLALDYLDASHWVQRDAGQIVTLPPQLTGRLPQIEPFGPTSNFHRRSYTTAWDTIEGIAR
jgi:hypothetical protein